LYDRASTGDLGFFWGLQLAPGSHNKSKNGAEMEEDMAFCGNCGTHAEDNEHFCRNCGHDLTAASPHAQPPAPPADAQPYLAPGAIPPGAIPLAPPAAKKTMSTPVRVLVFIVGLVAIWSGLKQMGVIKGPSTPSGGGTGSNAIGTLATQATGAAQQESFTGQWAVANGEMQINKGVWNNQSNVAVQSVVMECDQYDNNNSDQAQKQITLVTTNRAALPAGDTADFKSIDMGPAVENVAKVNCGILSATTQ
jgi:hypothetical protein